MSTVHPIDEEDLTEVGQDGTQEQTPPCPETSSHSELKVTIMNSKLLFAATVAVSLIGTLALADQANAATLTRAEVKAELAQAIANGTLQRSDYGNEFRAAANVSTTSREQVAAQWAAAQAGRARLVGPDANRTYNPYGTAILQTSNLARAQVQAEVRQAAADGTLQRTDYADPMLAARQAHAQVASQRVAQRLKAALRHIES